MTSKQDQEERRANYVTINGREYYRMRKRVGVYKNKRGEWRPRYKFFYGKNRKDAQRKYDLYMARPSFEADKPLGELLEQYIETVFTPDSSLKDTTKSRYLNAYHLCFNGSKLSEMPLSAITGADIQQAINDATVAPSSVKQALNLVKRFYRYIAAQHIAQDVTTALVLPEITHRRKDQTIETFTDAELRTFIEKTPQDHRLRLLVLLGIKTGARVAELLALKYSDFREDHLIINKALAEIDPVRDPDQEERDKVRAEIITTKSQTSDRTIPIDEELLQALEDHKSWHISEMKNKGYESEFVFTTSSGSLYYKSTVRTAFKRLCKSIGIAPRGFHTFRHTFGTRLAAAGVPIQTVSALMGHSDISVTAKYYINVQSDAKKDALNRIKLY